jgi:hypothetical protein
MKPIKNFGLMLDKYAPQQVEEIKNRLLKYSRQPIKKSNEMARQAFDVATSFVPVIGSAREAVRDANKGDYGWAVINAASAALETGLPLFATAKLLKKFPLKK